MSDAVASQGEDVAEFDSYIVPSSDLEEGTLRLMETDQRILFPRGSHVRFVLGS